MLDGRLSEVASEPCNYMRWFAINAQRQGLIESSYTKAPQCAMNVHGLPLAVSGYICRYHEFRKWDAAKVLSTTSPLNVTQK